ncbi:efflux RND transporter periplasmic adaptor subunit [Woeseia oceani]|uniref:Uncharacterized protein n=1 Tax=Woeseia oceani TaxID=1548547 RepID=A0A193LDC7_9GAMM|nr:efflux RND transporter periplasmic adaptor subunit [Woeseia oceani]ANO50483.1 hypothetical protein BA177_03990 [Woeseia oceani]
MRNSALLLFVTLLLSSAQSFGQREGAQNATAVIVAPVVSGEFADQVEALGTTRANESVVITADRSEKVMAIHFDDGQAVKKGDLLLTLDKRQEEAQLRASQAVTDETRNSYNRAQGLSGTSALPRATLQERAAQLAQAQAVTDSLQASLTSYEITAPFDGILGLRQVSVGTLVQPGDQITTIDDLSQIKIDFDVPSVFLATLKPGLPIRGTIEAFGDRQFEGVVTTVNSRIDPITRTVIVRAIIPNPDNILKPGLLMSITLYKNPRQTLLVPEEALIKRADRNYVYVIEQDQGQTIARQRSIELGARKPGIIEVLSGLEEGDKVVVQGIIKLRDGMPVSIRAEQTGNESLEDLLTQKPTTGGQ